jgi:hypothetical protein
MWLTRGGICDWCEIEKSVDENEKLIEQITGGKKMPEKPIQSEVMDKMFELIEEECKMTTGRETYTKTPKPGTDEAVRLGCICPRIDNHYGKGSRGDGVKYGWYVTGGCKLHDKT